MNASTSTSAGRLISTVFSMLLSFGVYWTTFGPWFALGLIGSIYVHEMGHVAALMRYGIPASAPMFIPGVGAFVRMHRAPLTPVEDARVGLAGPIWGTAAALAAFGIAQLIGSPLWMAIAHTGAFPEPCEESHRHQHGCRVSRGRMTGPIVTTRGHGGTSRFPVLQ